MDPTIRLAAQRVTAWHMARVLLSADTPEQSPTPDADAPDPMVDPLQPGQNSPIRDPSPSRG